MTRTTLPCLGSPAVSTLRATRTQSVESARRHLALRRQVKLANALTVVFEDRQTVWFRVQELSRCASKADVGRQLDWYERLMPEFGHVRAAVWLNMRGKSADAWRQLVSGGRLILRSSSGHFVVGESLPQRVTDRLIGLIGWVEFRFNTDTREALHDPTTTWQFCLETADGDTLATDVEESVLESLSNDVG